MKIAEAIEVLKQMSPDGEVTLVFGSNVPQYSKLWNENLPQYPTQPYWVPTDHTWPFPSNRTTIIC